LGYDGITTALAASKGEHVPTSVDTGASLITKANMNSPRSQELLSAQRYDFAYLRQHRAPPLAVCATALRSQVTFFPGSFRNRIAPPAFSFDSGRLRSEIWLVCDRDVVVE
jgi:hypothetical protein